MSRPGDHADGYTWHRHLISNTQARTLVDPDGHHVAHVYRGQRCWIGVDADGGMFTTAPSLAEALQIADNRHRPCAWHGRVLGHDFDCIEDRAPDSIYCPGHTGQAVTP